MDVKVLASAERGRNRVALLEVDYTPERLEHEALPLVYLLTFLVHDRAEHPQSWSRTDFDSLAARELYDQAVAEFITPEVEP